MVKPGSQLHLGSSRKKNEVRIEYLYLDLNTCDRCMGTDSVLEEVIGVLTPAFALAGYTVTYRKTLVATEQDAILHKLVSSPTIRVNGRDICASVQENDCSSCGDIAGTQVNCRVYTYKGKQYEVPPAEMLAEAILKAAFAPRANISRAENYILPDNLGNFFTGKARKCCEGSSSCKCC